MVERQQSEVGHQDEVSQLKQVVDQLQMEGMHRLPGVPTFTGAIHESFQDFMDTYQLAADSEGWTDQKKASQLWKYLDKAARTFWSEQANRLDWNAIQNVLKEHFTPPEVSQFHSNLLIQRCQGQNESLAEYGVSISKLVRNAFPNVGAKAQLELQRTYFIRGLRPDLFFHVMSTQPEASYDQAYQLARNYDTAKKLLWHAKLNPQINLDNEIRCSQVFAGFTIPQQANVSRKVSSGHQVPPRGVDYPCPRPTLWGRQTQLNPTICYNCRRHGPIAQECHTNSEHHQSATFQGNKVYHQTRTPVNLMATESTAMGCGVDYKGEYYNHDSTQYLKEPDTQFTAVFPIKINGRCFHALLDTGASISLIRASVAEKLKLQVKEPSMYKVSGITGHTFDLQGVVSVKLQIGRRKLFRQPLHLAASPPYDVLIGLDLLKRLGSITLNFSKNQLHLHARPPKPTADIVPMKPGIQMWTQQNNFLEKTKKSAMVKIQKKAHETLAPSQTIILR